MTATTTTEDIREAPTAWDDRGAHHGKLCIVVADRGNVWVGQVFDGARHGWLKLTSARVVRRWGTSEGLNELATKGPRPQTRLDAVATVLVPERAVIAIIPCEPSAWTA
jgi:hypothetical protein